MATGEWTPEALMDLIERNSDKIAVRAQVDGRFGNFFLSELPGNQAIAEAFRLVRRGTAPIMTALPEDDPSLLKNILVDEDEPPTTEWLKTTVELAQEKKRRSEK
jgi:hypothetical protein